MTRGTSHGLVRVLGHVSAIVVIPILGGAVIGIALDGVLRTTPLFVLSGFVIGNLVAAVGVWIYIRVNRARLAGGELDRQDDR